MTATCPSRGSRRLDAAQRSATSVGTIWEGVSLNPRFASNRRAFLAQVILVRDGDHKVLASFKL